MNKGHHRQDRSISPPPLLQCVANWQPPTGKLSKQVMVKV